MKKKTPFSKYTLIAGINKATYYKYISCQCEANHLNFLKLLETEYRFLLNKRFVQKALINGFYLAIRRRKEASLQYLFEGELFSFLSTKMKLRFFYRALILDHKHYANVLKWLMDKNFDLLQSKKIKNAIYCMVLRAIRLKKQHILNLFLANNLLLLLSKDEKQEVLKKLNTSSMLSKNAQDLLIVSQIKNYLKLEASASLQKTV